MDPAKPDPSLLAKAEALSTSPSPAPALPPGAPLAPGAPAGPNWRQEARDLWACVAALGVRWPSLAKVFTTETVDRLADVWGPILERHQLTFGSFTIYVSAALVTVPVLGASVQAIRADNAAEKAAAQPPADAPAPAS